MTDTTTILAPLDRICKERGYTYTWRTSFDGKKWRADVRAGWPVVDGKATGAHPWWMSLRDTEEEALADAVNSAVVHWDR